MDQPEAGPSQLTPRQRAKSPIRSIPLSDINLEESLVDQDIALLITRWLESKSYHEAARTVESEILGVRRTVNQVAVEVERALFDGNYEVIEGLLGKGGIMKPQAQKSFLYLCYRQQFLEYIENRESQKAFNLLSKRLKPLEHYQPIPYDFYNLAYLTSAGTVHDAPGLKDWSGEALEREKLVGTWRELMKHVPWDEVKDQAKEDNGSSGAGAGASEGGTGSEKARPWVGEGRLEELVKQAGAWQVQQARQRGSGPWTLKSLLQDYQPLVIPSRLSMLVMGHKANVKCVDNIGHGSGLAVSGSSDATLRVFSRIDGLLRHSLLGHTSRIWDCSTSPSGNHLASASGDGDIRIWSPSDGECRTVLRGDGGDVYSVTWKPDGESQVASASYDRILRVWDVEAGKQIRTFSGHTQSTFSVAYDNTGKLIASGAKDKCIRLWDAVGGMCAQNITDCLGEVTSVQFDREGKYLLAGCKDNSNRLFDLRMQRNIYRYTGHQNTSKNLIRCSFASNDQLVISGSEDGQVYIWSREAPSPPTPDSSNPAQNALPTMTTMNHNHNQGPTAGAGPTTETYRASPAYYPPRDLRQTQQTQKANANSSGINVRPLRTLGGHGDGAVFDVRWYEGGILSAGGDGTVGMWGFDEEDQDQD